MTLDTDITSWGGTIVTPGQPAYNKEEHKKESEEDEAAKKAEEEEEGEKAPAMES